MKRRDLDRLKRADKAAVTALIVEQPGAVLVRRKDRNKGFTDLPLFATDSQTKLF